MEKIKTYISKHANIFCILSLIFFCYLFLFHGLWMYPLIDVDETRYVQMAKEMIERNDWVTMYLNYIPFLEKPPLYYWLIGLSFKIFGVNEFAARFPSAMLGAFGVFFTYFFGKKALSPSFGLISALILLSSIWYLLFVHVAILDLGISVLIMASIYCAFLVFFTQEKSHKFCWLFAWIFAALGVLYKGLPGVAVPALVIFATFALTGKIKEPFRLKNIVPGLILFFLISLPWHIMILKAQGDAFVQMYIIKHHFARFVSSEGLGRKQPFLFYLPIFLAGLMPWTFSFIAAAWRAIKTAIKDFKSVKSLKPLFSTDSNDKKLLVMMSVYLIVAFVFYSMSSSKLPPYILAIFPPAAFICGYMWWGWVVWDRFERSIKVSTYLLAALLILAGCAAILVPIGPETSACLFHKAGGCAFPISIPVAGYVAAELDKFKDIASLWCIIMPFIMILCLVAKNKPLTFITKIFFMVGVMLICTTYVFTFVYNAAGQNELVRFSDRAKAIEGAKLVAFDFPVKSSMLWTYEEKVNFIREEDFDALKQALKTKDPVFVVVKNKNLENYGKKKLRNLKFVEAGHRYTLLVKQ